MWICGAAIGGYIEEHCRERAPGLIALVVVSAAPAIKMMCLPTERGPVSIVACTPSVGELNVPSVGCMAVPVPPAMGGVSI